MLIELDSSFTLYKDTLDKIIRSMSTRFLWLKVLSFDLQSSIIKHILSMVLKLIGRFFYFDFNKHFSLETQLVQALYFHYKVYCTAFYLYLMQVNFTHSSCFNKIYSVNDLIGDYNPLVEITIWRYLKLNNDCEQEILEKNFVSVFSTLTI